MTTFADGSHDEIVVFFTNARGQRKKSLIRVLHAASQANVETLISKMQALSKMSIKSYRRIASRNSSDAQAATEFDPAAAPFALLTEELKLLYTCGPDQVNTRSSIFGPDGANLIKGDNNTMVGDLTASAFTELETAAKVVQVNTAGALVATLEEAKKDTTKASK